MFVKFDSLGRLQVEHAFLVHAAGGVGCTGRILFSFGREESPIRESEYLESSNCSKIDRVFTILKYRDRYTEFDQH
jgi:hypothetical protein